jgi:predicted small lipoprotein YifL
MIDPSIPSPRHWLRHALLLALIAAVSVPLTGCGKKSPLDPPAGTEDTTTYPRQYPTK